MTWDAISCFFNSHTESVFFFPHVFPYVCLLCCVSMMYVILSRFVICISCTSKYICLCVCACVYLCVCVCLCVLSMLIILLTSTFLQCQGVLKSPGCWLSQASKKRACSTGYPASLTSSLSQTLKQAHTYWHKLIQPSSVSHIHTVSYSITQSYIVL